MPHATNASVMRDENRKLILNLIRLQPISRVELAEQTHLTRASVTQIVDDLLSAGLVEEKEAVVCSSRGRRRVTLVLKGSGHYVFGVNIGRTNCHVGLMNLAGEVGATGVILECVDYQNYTPEMATAIRDFGKQ